MSSVGAEVAQQLQSLRWVAYTTHVYECMTSMYVHMYIYTYVHVCVHVCADADCYMLCSANVTLCTIYVPCCVLQYREGGAELEMCHTHPSKTLPTLTHQSIRLCTLYSTMYIVQCACMYNCSFTHCMVRVWCMCVCVSVCLCVCVCVCVCVCGCAGGGGGVRGEGPTQCPGRGAG